MDRALASGAKGLRFESCRVRQFEREVLLKNVVAIAQLVESRIVIPVVAGSSPVSHPTSVNSAVW